MPGVVFLRVLNIEKVELAKAEISKMKLQIATRFGQYLLSEDLSRGFLYVSVFSGAMGKLKRSNMIPSFCMSS